MDIMQGRFIEVIVPLKFNGGIAHYRIPEDIEGDVVPGSWVVA